MRQRAAFFAALFYHDVYFFLIGEFFIPSLHEHFHKRNRDNTTGPSDSITHSILSLNSRKTNNIKYLCFVFTLFFLSRQGLRCSLTDKFLTQQLYEQRRNITISRMQEKRVGYY